MATTKAQLESKVTSLEALLNAEVRAHAATKVESEQRRQAIDKLDAEWKATVAGMRARHALEYRKLTNTSGVSIADRASVSAGSQRPAEGETNLQFIARMRKESQSQTATH